MERKRMILCIFIVAALVIGAIFGGIIGTIIGILLKGSIIIAWTAISAAIGALVLLIYLANGWYSTGLVS